MKRYIALCMALAVSVSCLSACTNAHTEGTGQSSDQAVREITMNGQKEAQTEGPASSLEATKGPSEGKPKKKGYKKIISHDKIESFEGTIKIGDTAYELYNYVDSSAEKYADVVNAVAKKLKGKADVYDIVAPTSIGITLPDNKVSKVNSSNQKKSIKSIYKKLSASVKTVSLYDVLMRHRTEYIYFRTDHHWTGKGAYYAYQAFCRKKKMAYHELSEYGTETFGTYLGSFYVDTGQDKSLKRDRVRVFYPVAEKKMKLTYQDEQGAEFTSRVITDGSGFGISLKYVAFLAGDNPFSVVKNKKVKDGSSCLIVKESYGNPFTPYLADHYQTVYVVDYRYWTGSISDLAIQHQVDDVIFLNNISMTRNAYLIGKLAQVQ